MTTHRKPESAKKPMSFRESEAFFFFIEREGNEQYAADEKAQTRDLHGRKHAVHGFEHDLHRAENDGTEDDIDIAGAGTVHSDSPFIIQTKAVYAIFCPKARDA